MIKEILERNIEKYSADKKIIEKIIEICKVNFASDQKAFTKRTNSITKLINKISEEEFKK